MNVVFIANHNYLRPLSVTIGSLLQSLGHDRCALDLYLVGSSLSSMDKEKLQEWIILKGAASLTIINPLPIEGITERSLLWQKLLLPSLLPQDMDIVLYLDSDLLVRRAAALVEQYNIFKSRMSPIDDPPMLQAIQDIGLPSGRHLLADSRFWGLWSSSKPYFNAGLLFMNLKAFRQR